MRLPRRAPLLRLLTLLLLLSPPAWADEDPPPGFPKPASEGGPALPPERPPGFPAPASEGGPALPDGELTPTSPTPEPVELTPTFPTPEGANDDDSADDKSAPAPTPAARGPEPSLPPELVDAFAGTQQLAARIEQAESQMTMLALQRIAAATPQRVRELDGQIAGIKEEAATLRGSVHKLAAGIDTTGIEEEPEGMLSWDEELTELLAPVMQELKRATEKPREMERLRIRSAHYTTRLAQVNGGITRVTRLLAEARDGVHRAELEAVLAELQATRTALEGELEAAAAGLADVEKDNTGLVTGLRQVFEVFFADRGRNIVVTFVTFVLVFLLLLGLRHLAVRSVPPARRASLLFRTVDLAALLGTVIAATFAGLSVLFVSGDWVLLTVAAIVLFGVFWGARQSIPQFWGEIRLLLNIGAVREGERVLYDDLPWLVETLHLVSILKNPAFPGVHIRLPMSAMSELVSRPFLPEEPWFPTQVGDIVDLGDEGWGPVVFQSPEVVQARIQGALRTFAAADWYGEPPINLSTGWRTDVLLTLDYRHQGEITTTIPERLQAFLRERFADHDLAPHLQKLTVGFEQMADSSLDLEISCWFDGAGAPRWEAAEEDLAALCVDACNQFGWVIAFPQLTVTKAPA